MSEKNKRVAQYGVEEMFLDRWLFKSFSPKKIDQEQIDQLFEAAHWPLHPATDNPGDLFMRRMEKIVKSSTASSMIVMRCGPLRLRC